MKVTNPQEIASGASRVEGAVGKFEEHFTKHGKDQQYYHLVIIGEYNRQTCDEVEKLYTQAGWYRVKCRTSSENGERSGLTGLQLYLP